MGPCDDGLVIRSSGVAAWASMRWLSSSDEGDDFHLVAV